MKLLAMVSVEHTLNCQTNTVMEKFVLTFLSVKLGNKIQSAGEQNGTYFFTGAVNCNVCIRFSVDLQILKVLQSKQYTRRVTRDIFPTFNFLL